MGSAGSTLQRRESLRRRRLRSRHTQGSNPRLAVEARERPLEVQEALFDWRLLPKRKRKWMEKEYAWEKSSPNIEINSENPTVFLRHPVAQRTDLARGKLVMEHGLHLWKFTWPAGQRGTHALIGVCTDDMSFTARGYTHLLGSTKSSWGWDLSRRGLYHNNKRSSYDYPTEVSYSSEPIPEVIVMIVDMEAGTLAFEVDSRYQGIAFKGLKGKKLYAAASAVWGNCNVEMKYLGSALPGEVKPLAALARNTIRRSMGARRLADGCVGQLSLPDFMKMYILCHLPQRHATREEDRDAENNRHLHAREEELDASIAVDAEIHEDPIVYAYPNDWPQTEVMDDHGPAALSDVHPIPVDSRLQEFAAQPTTRADYPEILVEATPPMNACGVLQTDLTRTSVPVTSFIVHPDVEQTDYQSDNSVDDVVHTFHKAQLVSRKLGVPCAPNHEPLLSEKREWRMSGEPFRNRSSVGSSAARSSTWG